MSQAAAHEAAFDDLYRATRSDVLLQAFLLTGDLPAATAAVKDAYTIAWQHWPKVVQRQAKGEEPLSYIRPLAWRLAQRRHTGRIWHRNKGLTDDHKLVLDAVHKLSGGHRRLLLLVDIAGVELGEAARELAVTHAAAETRLQEARDEISGALGPDYLTRLTSLAEPAAGAKLPRPTVLLRAGRERRRLHTVGAVAGAIALTVGVGAAAREPGLERASAIHQVRPGGQPVGEKLPDGVKLTTPAQLLEAYQLGGLTPAQIWSVVRTDNNTRGDGINTVCQQTRFADPRGLAALVRTFDTASKPLQSALQTVEISRDDAAARTAYATTIQWFAGCQAARLQMISAHEVTGIGDEADLLQMQVAGKAMSTYNIGVARVGEVTTTIVTRTTGTPPKPMALATTLSDAVGKLCPSDRAGCSGVPALQAVPPPPSGEELGFVATVDLPPAGALRQPWVGVTSVNALRRNDATTRCDQANWRRSGATRARSRTFLIPQAQVPETFGFTETYAVFPNPKKAAAFLEGVRKSVDGCEDRDLTTTTSSEHRETKPRMHDLSVWRFESKVSEETMVAFRVGFVRVGNTVAKLTFVPDANDDMHPAAFEALVRRAGERLRELP